MNIEELIKALEEKKDERGNIEVVKSDYELGPTTINNVEIAELNPLIIDEDCFDSKKGEKILRIG